MRNGRSNTWVFKTSTEIGLLVAKISKRSLLVGVFKVNNIKMLSNHKWMTILQLQYVVEEILIGKGLANIVDKDGENM